MLPVAGLTLGVASSSPWCEDPGTPPAVGMYGPGAIASPLIGVTPTGDADVDGLFAQALGQEWNFNARESRRNFERVVELAPACAICWWGLARSYAANINRDEVRPRLVDAADRALRTLRTVDGAKVWLLVGSIQRLRVPVDANASVRAAHRGAYAHALCAAVDAGNADADVGALCADATMATSPWRYYVHRLMEEGSSPLLPRLAPIARVLERLTAPSAVPHALAQHLLIHLYEPRTGPRANPLLGQAAADALEGRFVAAGHLQHMPAHIYLRTGRWRDGLAASDRALAAGDAYLERCLCPYAHAHNIDMGIWHALLLGSSRDALRLARRHAADAAKYAALPVAAACGSDGVARDSSWEALVLTRFGRWDVLLARGYPPECEPPPAAEAGEGSVESTAKNAYAHGGAYWCDAHRSRRLFAYGMALEASGADSSAVVAELSQLANPDSAACRERAVRRCGGDATRAAALELSARVLMRRGELPGAASALRNLTTMLDARGYSEPPLYAFPAPARAPTPARMRAHPSAPRKYARARAPPPHRPAPSPTKLYRALAFPI